MIKGKYKIFIGISENKRKKLKVILLAWRFTLIRIYFNSIMSEKDLVSFLKYIQPNYKINN